MAAPANKTIHNLNGKWQMNKALSDPFEPVLALQGVGYLIRKAISAATITLVVTQLVGPPSEPTSAQDPVDDAARREQVTHVNIDQLITAGLKGTTERRCVDNRRREHTDWLFGHVEGRTLWFKGPGAAAAVVKEFGDDFLVKGLPAAADDSEDLLVSHVVNLDAGRGWVATQVWSFQPSKDGARRYTRNIVVTKGAERIAVQLVYDFVGERDDAAAEDTDLTY